MTKNRSIYYELPAIPMHVPQDNTVPRFVRVGDTKIIDFYHNIVWRIKDLDEIPSLVATNLLDFEPYPPEFMGEEAEDLWGWLCSYAVAARVRADLHRNKVEGSTESE